MQRMQRCALAVLLVATLQSLPTSQAAGTGKYLVTNGCPTGSTCMFQPEGCVRRNMCNLGLAVRKDTSDPDGGYTFEMWASYKGFVAVALADQVGMGNDSVIECVAVDDKVTAYMSRNFPPTFKQVHARLPEADQADITQLSSGNKDGVITCKVRRRAITTVFGKTYDLTSGYWVVQLVAGDKADANGISHHDVWVQTTQKYSISKAAGPLPLLSTNDPSLPSSGSVVRPALAALAGLILAAVQYI